MSRRRDAKVPRRTPKQPRSEGTVAAILEATDRVLVGEGQSAVTTTRVAVVAGVSVGTLYQYFPTREALLAAWEERMLTGLLERFKTRVAEALASPPGTLEQLVFAIAHDTIDFVARTALLYRFEVGESVFTARTEMKIRLGNECIEFLTQALRSFAGQLRPSDAPVAAILVVKVVMNMAFVVAPEHPDTVERGDFQRELATMVARYLVVDERLRFLPTE